MSVRTLSWVAVVCIVSAVAVAQSVQPILANQNRTLAGKLGELKSKTESLREDFEQRVRGVTGIFRKDEVPSVKDVMAAGASAVEELRGKVDGAVKQAVEALGGPNAISAEIDKLQKRIQELEKKIEQLLK